MKRIKAFALLLGVVVLASCASQKRVIYLQDTQADEQVKIAQDYQIRIKPLDRLTVVVNSRDPELAAPFNTSTSLNSLTGTPLSTYSSNSASLQIRTVDENGDPVTETDENGNAVTTETETTTTAAAWQ